MVVVITAYLIYKVYKRCKLQGRLKSITRKSTQEEIELRDINRKSTQEEIELKNIKRKSNTEKNKESLNGEELLTLEEALNEEKLGTLKIQGQKHLVKIVNVGHGQPDTSKPGCSGYISLK